MARAGGSRKNALSASRKSDLRHASSLSHDQLQFLFLFPLALGGPQVCAIMPRNPDSGPTHATGADI